MIFRRAAHGVVGVISAFNFPLILSIRAVAPAFVLGNTVVLKPDPQTPVTGASGNGGRHGGPASWEEFTQWQWVTIQDRATRYPL